MAGLQPIDRGIRAQKPVAVLLLDVVPGELMQAEQRIEIRKVRDQVMRQQAQVARRSVVIRVGQNISWSFASVVWCCTARCGEPCSCSFSLDPVRS